MGRVAGACLSERVGGRKWEGSRASESSQVSATLLDRWFSVQPTSSKAKSSGSCDRWISAYPTEERWGCVYVVCELVSLCVCVCNGAGGGGGGRGGEGCLL